jgi:ribosomal protein S18 acetylase RimI-like enzyme
VGQLTIRECRPDEAADVLALWRAAVVGRDDSWLLVAEEDGRFVGTLIAGWDGWRGHLYRLAVLPERRRRGIATALVIAGEERLRALGARRLTAIVLLDHGDAAGFWTAAGFAHQIEAGRFVKTV